MVVYQPKDQQRKTNMTMDNADVRAARDAFIEWSKRVPIDATAWDIEICRNHDTILACLNARLEAAELTEYKEGEIIAGVYQVPKGKTAVGVHIVAPTDNKALDTLNRLEHKIDRDSWDKVEDEIQVIRKALSAQSVDVESLRKEYPFDEHLGTHSCYEVEAYNQALDDIKTLQPVDLSKYMLKSVAEYKQQPKDKTHGE